MEQSWSITGSSASTPHDNALRNVRRNFTDCKYGKPAGGKGVRNEAEEYEAAPAPPHNSKLLSTYFDACCFLRSAHRFFIASAMRLRPSGESRRLRLPAFAAGAAVLCPVADALGRPGLRLWGSPVNSSRACCSREISASISCTSRLKSTFPPIIFLCRMSYSTTRLITSRKQTDSITIQNIPTTQQIFMNR